VQANAQADAHKASACFFYNAGITAPAFFERLAAGSQQLTGGFHRQQVWLVTDGIATT